MGDSYEHERALLEQGKALVRSQLQGMRPCETALQRYRRLHDEKARDQLFNDLLEQRQSVASEIARLEEEQRQLDAAISKMSDGK
jgi:uncharacterized protein YdcH (DUF465 family)